MRLAVNRGPAADGLYRTDGDDGGESLRKGATARHLGAHEHPVAEAIAKPGCPVCRLARESEARYWDWLLYEGFQDGEAEIALRASIGYCARHELQLAARWDVFPQAILARAGVEGAVRALEGRPRRRPRLPAPGAACPVCAYAGSSERDAISILGRIVAELPDCREAYERSEGVCFDHLVLAREAGAPAWPFLRDHALARLRCLRDELDRLVASFDYRARPAGPELARAWRRAFAALRGSPGRSP